MRLDDRLIVTSLEDFVSAAGDELIALIRQYWSLMRRDKGIAGPDTEVPKRLSSSADFFAALGLNPALTISYCRVASPDEISQNPAHDPSRSGPPGASYVDTPPATPLSVREVLAVFSDEPDWGMDQGLFAINVFGYGDPPFGAKQGHSSQACFHMAFLHEHPLLLRIFPQLDKSFLEQRTGLFLALAELARRIGTDYWAWRFSAWAMHYLQDLTQPYHAKALPFSLWAVLKRFARDPSLEAFKERNKNLLMNRHHLFESVVHCLLNEAARACRDHPFITALKGRGDCVHGALPAIMREISAVAAGSAVRVNRALERLLDDPKLDDPGYFVDEDPSYPLEPTLTSARETYPDVFAQFLDLVSICLIQTGRVSRSIVERVEGIDSLESSLKVLSKQTL